MSGELHRRRRSHCQRRHARRRAVAATEFAVALPLLMLLLLGSIETANVIQLQQAIQLTAYETATSATSTKGSSDKALARGAAVLQAFQVEGATIDIQPPITPGVQAGTSVRITVTAPCDANALCPPWFFRGKTLTAEVQMARL